MIRKYHLYYKTCSFQYATSTTHHLLSHRQQKSPLQSSHPAILWSRLTSVPQYYRNSHIVSLLLPQHPTILWKRLASVPQYNHNHHYARFSTSHDLKLPNHEREDKLDYKVSIKDRDVVRAARGPDTEYWLTQSNLDLLLPPLQAGVFFCYQKKDNSMSSEMVVKRLKKSLAGVLSAFYPLAGEMVANGQGEPEVLCNNVGVEFVHAYANVELKNLDLHYPDQTVKGKLVPKINRGLLAVQVTELNCGSIIISCAFDHRIADGASINMFLVAWSDYTNFTKISTFPSFHRSILNPRRPPPPPNPTTIYDNLYLPISTLPPPPPNPTDQLQSRFFYIPAHSITHLQSQSTSLNGTRRTKFESFTAFVWKLLAQEETNEANTVSRIGVVVNGRRFLTPETHFGNVLSIPYSVARNHDLRVMRLSDIANKVHDEILSEVTTKEHFRGLIDWVESHRPEPAVARIYFKLRESDGEAVVVSSGQGLPIGDVNFGYGEAVFGSYHLPWGGETGYMTTMPSAKKNGDWIIYAHLKQKHLDLIERTACDFFKPITQSYLGFS